MSLIPVFNKISPWAYTELKLDVLGVPKKLVKYVVHSSKKNWKKIIFLHASCPNNYRPVFGLIGLKEFYRLSRSRHIMKEKTKLLTTIR
jgi:hypothetical protein